MRNAAVLRQRFLIRLQPREKFDAAENALGDFGGQFGAGRDDAVEPEADLGGFAAHLEMDVARAGALGLADKLLQDFRRCVLGMALLCFVLIFPGAHGFSNWCSTPLDRAARDSLRGK